MLKWFVLYALAISSVGSLILAKAEAANNIILIDKNLYSPQEGVICDTIGIKYCADRTGVSEAQTLKFLGRLAVDILSQEMKGADRTVFTLNNGVQCRVSENACFKRKWSSEKSATISRIVFLPTWLIKAQDDCIKQVAVDYGTSVEKVILRSHRDDPKGLLLIPGIVDKGEQGRKTFLCKYNRDGALVDVMATTSDGRL
jgi:hypothetical protein